MSKAGTIPNSNSKQGSRGSQYNIEFDKLSLNLKNYESKSLRKN
jgi:hypothetical protein